MSTLTGRTVKRLEGTGRGSDYWGGCDRCGKPMSEAFKLSFGREYKRENGELYDNAHAMSYGHRECLVRDYELLPCEAAVAQQEPAGVGEHE